MKDGSWQSRWFYSVEALTRWVITWMVDPGRHSFRIKIWHWCHTIRWKPVKIAFSSYFPSQSHSQIYCFPFFRIQSHWQLFWELSVCAYIALLCTYTAESFFSFSASLVNIYQKLPAHEFNLSSYVIKNEKSFGNKCFWTISSQASWWWWCVCAILVIEFRLFWEIF